MKQLPVIIILHIYSNIRPQLYALGGWIFAGITITYLFNYKNQNSSKFLFLYVGRCLVAYKWSY